MNKAEKIKTLNDRARRAMSNAFVSNGIKAMGDKEIALIIDKVKNYETFNKGNDPYGEHDFGSFMHNGEKIFWKIDYYDRKSTKYASSDPSDINVTTRVLTIMLAEEY